MRSSAKRKWATIRPKSAVLDCTTEATLLLMNCSLQGDEQEGHDHVAQADEPQRAQRAPALRQGVPVHAGQGAQAQRGNQGAE